MKTAATAKKNLLRMLARRDHSEKELGKKLSRDFSEKEISEALNWAREQNWLKVPAELSQKIAQHLNEKLKGIQWINQTLEEKGLPLVSANAEHEIEKARKLLKRKQDVSVEKQKAYLARHGFEIETMGKVIDEKQ